MPHHDYYSRRGAYSPPSSATYSDPYDRYERPPPPRGAVQPYRASNGHYRDPYAVEPYHASTSPRGQIARRRRSDSNLSPADPPQSKSQQTQGWFKDHGAELVGAAAGGYAGKKRGDDALTTASGAAVGAIGGKIVEHQYRKWNDKRQDKKVGHAVRHDRSPRGRGMDISPDEYYEPRYSRSVGARSRSRGRGRGRSESRGRQKSPSTWKDLAGQIRRELSRKREKSRPRSEYSDYSR